MLSPSIRFYSQSAASFYAPNTTITLDSNDPSLPAQLTDYYNNVIHSADHRLSRFDSVTYGVKLTATLHEHVWLDFAYKRYEMRGTDGVTPASVFPSADVFTAGLRLWY